MSVVETVREVVRAAQTICKRIVRKGDRKILSLRGQYNNTLSPTLNAQVIQQTGRGDLPMVRIETHWSETEIYLLGACVTHFQRHGEPPLLFLSEKSRFENGSPIRGGIPVIFPWFGKPVDKSGQHGFVRARPWEFVEAKAQPDGIVTALFRLPPCPELPSIAVEYVVAIGETLTVELIVTNKSSSNFAFENCLHTYFTVGDINAVSVVGLKGVDYLDSLDGASRKTEAGDAIRFTGEVDRIYINTPQAAEIRDGALHRGIRVEKENSLSTVVWNPWIAKSRAMADFGDEEYQRMVCVESGNVRDNSVALAPGQSARLKVKLSSTSLK